MGGLGVEMRYSGIKFTFTAGVIILLSLFAVLQLFAYMESKAHAPVLSIIPGLVGAGVGTPAGSGSNRVGGSIIHVTTLADSGAGSLREALETSGPRIVVFDVSGYIELQSEIKVKQPYLTIAGQTAPFPGITLKGADLSIRTHDVLIQHIRIRVGDEPNGPKPSNRDAVEILNWPVGENVAYNIVIDHISASWSIDENMSTWYEGVHDISVTNSIISEALWHSLHPSGPHSKGFLVGNGTRNLSVIGNLFAHNHDRNMRVHGDTSTLFVNNLIYNWGYGSSGYGTSVGLVLDASIVGNVYIRGLDTEKPFPLRMHQDIVTGSRVYVEDTEAIEKSSEPWSVVTVNSLAPPESEIRVDTPPIWIPSIKPKKANKVKKWVLDNAGARRADADPVDFRIINDVKNGTGRIIDSQNDVGGWPPLANNVRGVGGIPVLSIPSNEIQPSGYTKVEEWLHFLAKQVEVPK